MNADEKPKRGKGITRESLVSAALAIVDRDGLDALSMRRLGAELGIDPMAAYRHLPNKEALLDGVVEAVVAEVPLDVEPGSDWRMQLRQLVEANVRTLLAHPNTVPLIAQRPLTTPRSMLLVEKALEITSAAGIPLKDAILAVNTMGMLTAAFAIAVTASRERGVSAEESQGLYAALPAEQFPRVAEAMATGQFIESYDQLLDFWTGALFDRLEQARSHASNR